MVNLGNEILRVKSYNFYSESNKLIRFYNKLYHMILDFSIVFVVVISSKVKKVSN